jgi:hypothetical protein
VILTTLYLAGAKNTDIWRTRKGDLQRTTALDVLMVPSSSIGIIANGERLACGAFSLGKPVRFGNCEFIASYFSGLSLSLRTGNEGAIFVGSTHSGMSTPQQGTIEDSTEEFLTESSGEGSFGHPSTRRCSMGAPFVPIATATWKENAPATIRFPPRTVEPQLEMNTLRAASHSL